MLSSAYSSSVVTAIFAKKIEGAKNRQSDSVIYVCCLVQDFVNSDLNTILFQRNYTETTNCTYPSPLAFNAFLTKAIQFHVNMLFKQRVMVNISFTKNSTSFHISQMRACKHSKVNTQPLKRVANNLRQQLQKDFDIIPSDNLGSMRVLFSKCELD